jgi:hypothetical protein
MALVMRRVEALVCGVKGCSTDDLSMNLGDLDRSKADWRNGESGSK